jgi:tetratricopeptide (TPR) repeat protein
VTNARETKSLLMVKSSSRLLVELLARGFAADSQQDLLRLVRRIIDCAEHAYTCQDLLTLKEASELLLTFPSPQAQRAGLWYQAIVEKWEGQFIQAVHSLEQIIEDPHATPKLRARSLQTLGTILQGNGNLDTARELYWESAQLIRSEAPRDIYTFAQAVILSSYASADEGDNQQALNQLLSIEKIIHLSNSPSLTVYYYNNIAVELLELGRIDEAARYSRVACSLPLALIRPECKETALEIERHRASKTSVAVSSEPRKRPAQPKYLIIVLLFSPGVALKSPVTTRLRITCNNPTIALVMLVARIRAPSF